MKKCGIIYKITNLIDGMVYIGQTTGKPNRRWKQHLSVKIKYHLHNSINKYGKDNFKFEVIDTANSIDELNILEKFYIKNFNCLFPNGYNLTDGGKNGLKSEYTKQKMSLANKGKKLSEEHKKKCSESQLGEKSSWWGRKHSPETKSKISKGNRGRIVSDETIEKMKLSKLGKKASKETKVKMSLARKGRKSFLGTIHSEECRKKISIKSKNQLFPIKCIENNKTYINAARAAEDLNIKKQSIADYFFGKIKTANGFTFTKVLKEDYLANLNILKQVL